ncbi:H-type small acid-soluble spore protein [Texcoconibacillus texcoconensis]|uniref:Small, acid-soluble spore protein H n=1 Tax=Texcoconibacillus texcoconensis TaxID=1095777 RepID=A0A840QTN1_9BACI|nr:H-type small acid-soluble spore protein [Texcoconibacillus texcoconensis]MBB5174724.1 small acid-soluble spore protein H (minor) [Texcoconibacillus texcoconensis]
MNQERAEEISQSADTKNVTFQGKRIYIQHVDPHSKTARVFDLDNPEHEFDVQLTALQEHDSPNM